MSTPTPEPAPAQPASTLPPGHAVRLPFPMQDGETITALYRRHWWFLWPQSILLTLIAVVPVAVVAWVLNLIGVLDDLGIWFWLVAAVWLVVGALRLFFNWYRYQHDIWVVTNQRIVDVFKAHPLNLRVATADLVNIQDMSVVKSGLTPTLLNYGTVVLETAGADNVAFTIAGVPHPESIQLLIDRERDRERAAQRGTPPT
ncbi:MAG TPA: PH domain-containing protein [Dehalococcoidia bacterium]|nr:PH domain-containing protein [Dehalococcoidia bacterium]